MAVISLLNIQMSYSYWLMTWDGMISLAMEAVFMRPLIWTNWPEQGIRFTDAYAASPVCSPTRAAIMTGKHPARLHITDWIPGLDPKNKMLLGPRDEHQLPLEEISLAEAFKAHGYQTFFAGKWHLGNEGYFPEDQGFDINIGGHDKGSPPGGYYSPYKNPKLQDGPEGEYLPDRLTDEAINFIGTQKEDPFFLMLSYYTVHTPIQASKRHLRHFEDKAARIFPEQDSLLTRPEGEGITRLRQDRPDYASMVYAMDENIGRLVASLEEQGKLENTIIVFTSDNGGLSTLFPKRNPPTGLLPLRAGKGWCYEGGIRVPLIIRLPDSRNAGKITQEAVSSTDLFPSLMSLSGLPRPEGIRFDGVDISPALDGKSRLVERSLFWHFPHYHGSAWKPGSAIRKGKWKMLYDYESKAVELYDLEKDIEEQFDLSENYPDSLEMMKVLLNEWLSETNAQLPLPNDGIVED